MDRLTELLIASIELEQLRAQNQRALDRVKNNRAKIQKLLKKYGHEGQPTNQGR